MRDALSLFADRSTTYILCDLDSAGGGAVPAQNATSEYSVLSRCVDSTQSQLHSYGVCNSMHAQGFARETKDTSQGGGNYSLYIHRGEATHLDNESHWEYIFTGRFIPVFTSHFGSTSYSFEKDPSSGLETREHHVDR